MGFYKPIATKLFVGFVKKYFEPFCISLNIRIKHNHIIIVFNPVQ